MLHIFLIGHGTMDEKSLTELKLSNNLKEDKVVFYSPESCTTSSNLVEYNIKNPNCWEKGRLKEILIETLNVIEISKGVMELKEEFPINSQPINTKLSKYPIYQDPYHEHYWSGTTFDKIEQFFSKFKNYILTNGDTYCFAALRHNANNQHLKYTLSSIIDELDRANVGKNVGGYLIHWSICRAYANSKNHWFIKFDDNIKVLNGTLIDFQYSNGLHVNKDIQLVDFRKESKINYNEMEGPKSPSKDSSLINSGTTNLFYLFKDLNEIPEKFKESGFSSFKKKSETKTKERQSSLPPKKYQQ